MKVDIQSVHFNADQKLEERISAKVTKLNNFYDGINDAKVNLHLDNDATGDNKVAELKVLINGNEMFAKKQTNSFEESFDLAFEAVKNQLIKHKGKLKK